MNFPPIMSPFMVPTINNTQFNPSMLRGLEMWLDASDRSTITESSDVVQTWADKSGNGNNATKHASYNAPLTNQNTQNGKNVITFDSTNSEWLQANSIASLSSSSNTIAWVVRTSDLIALSKSFVCIGGFHQSGSNRGAYFAQDEGSVTFSAATENTVFPPGTTGANEWHVLVLSWNSTAVDVYLDGIFIDSVTVTYAGANQFSIGQDWDGATPSDHFDGQMAEILFYSRYFSRREARELCYNLMQKWNISEAIAPYYYASTINLWIDANRRQTIIKDVANLVSNWYDRGVNANNATQTSSPSKPLWVDSQLNSMPIIRAGPNDYMNLPDGTYPSANGDYTIYIVARSASVGNGAEFFHAGTSSINEALLVRRNTDDNFNTNWWTNNLNAGKIDNNYHLMVSYYDSSVGRSHFLNGVNVGGDSQTSKNLATTAHQVFFNHVGVDCYMAEMIVSTEADSVKKRRHLEHYLDTKWGGL